MKQFAAFSIRCREEAAELQRNLGPQDKAMLGDYLETVREIERRVQKMEKQELLNLNLPEPPLGIPPSFDEQLNLMFDIIALAYQANLTRIFTFMMAREATDRTYQLTSACPIRSMRFPITRISKPSWSRLERFRSTTRRSSPSSSPNCQDARWRRIDAGSFDHSLRKQYEQQQRP